MLKIAKFRTPTLQDVWQKGGKILKLPPVRNCFTLAMTNKLVVIINSIKKDKGKAVPLQAWTGPEGSRTLRFPDFVTTAQDGGRLLAFRSGRLYPQEMLLVLVSVRD